MLAYPQAARSAFIVDWADEHGILPCKALEMFQGHDHDIELILAHRAWVKKKQEEEQKKAAAKAASPSR